MREGRGKELVSEHVALVVDCPRSIRCVISPISGESGRPLPAVAPTMQGRDEIDIWRIAAVVNACRDVLKYARLAPAGVAARIMVRDHGDVQRRVDRDGVHRVRLHKIVAERDPRGSCIRPAGRQRFADERRPVTHAQRLQYTLSPALR